MMANDPVKMFRNVLVTHRNKEIVNSGIRLHGTHMKTYTQKNIAVSFKYFKRVILEKGGGIYSVPLPITLKPVP